jgi:hypothetical protein
MKRFAQFALVLAVGLLVTNPVFASSICVFGLSTACVPDCPMPMGGMSSDCPMANPVLAPGCPVNCCSHATLEATEPFTAAHKVRGVAQPAALAELAEIAIAEPVAVQRVSIGIRGAPPPIYILNQVFRI